MSGPDVLWATLRRASDKLAVAAWLRKCDRVGQSVQILGRPYVKNLGRIELGDGVVLGSRPVRSHLVTGVGGELTIGNDVRIGHGAAVAAHGSIRIGDGARLGSFVMLMDTDFHAVGDHQARPVARPIVIGRRARIGSRAIVMPGSRIGDDAEIDAGSVVSGAIPPGAFAQGVPARSLSRRETRSEDDLGGRVAKVVALALGLAQEPAPSDGPRQIAAWDSLGTLRLILAIEDEFEVTVREDDWVKVHSVQDVETLVEEARLRL